MPDPTPTDPPISSPPPSEQPARSEPNPGERLREVAREFLRTRDRRLLNEYLRLRAGRRN